MGWKRKTCVPAAAHWSPALTRQVSYLHNLLPAAEVLQSPLPTLSASSSTLPLPSVLTTPSRSPVQPPMSSDSSRHAPTGDGYDVVVEATGRTTVRGHLRAADRQWRDRAHLRGQPANRAATKSSAVRSRSRALTPRCHPSMPPLQRCAISGYALGGRPLGFRMPASTDAMTW